jgi:hypothetical protein
MWVRWDFRTLGPMAWCAVGLMTLSVSCLTPWPADSSEQPRTRSFHADISSEEEVKVKPSNGIGTADLTVDLATLKMNYKVSFKNLTSAPTQIALHGSIVRGMNAPVIIDLTPSGIKNPLEGTASITEVQLEYLLNREVYISIVTRKYKEGEIRGWFERRPDQQMKSLP